MKKFLLFFMTLIFLSGFSNLYSKKDIIEKQFKLSRSDLGSFISYKPKNSCPISTFITISKSSKNVDMLGYYSIQRDDWIFAKDIYINIDGERILAYHGNFTRKTYSGGISESTENKIVDEKMINILKQISTAQNVEITFLGESAATLKLKKKNIQDIKYMLAAYHFLKSDESKEVLEKILK